MDIGWSYLGFQNGCGNLTGNGTYVSLTNPDRTELTIIIETIVRIEVR